MQTCVCCAQLVPKTLSVYIQYAVKFDNFLAAQTLSGGYAHITIEWIPCDSHLPCAQRLVYTCTV